MATVLQTVPDVVKALGGAEAVAQLFGCKPNAVYNWTSSNRLPAKTYFEIRDRLRAASLSAPDALWAMAGPGKSPAQSAQVQP